MTHVQNDIISPLMLNPNSLLLYPKKQRSHKKISYYFQPNHELNAKYFPPAEDIIQLTSSAMSVVIDSSTAFLATLAFQIFLL